jgi:hypothetical protein
VPGEGYTRKYALTLLRHPPDEVPVKRRRKRSPSYGPAEVELLQLCWLITLGICSKRLAPFLPELLGRLRHKHALREFPVAVQTRVPGMSAATVDRALKASREHAKKRRGLSTTKAGTLLKRQIAIRTFADWSDARPGFLEMDLVAHCGWSSAGQFLYTLSMVDMATGWVACAGLRDKRKETVIPTTMRLIRGATRRQSVARHPALTLLVKQPADRRLLVDTADGLPEQRSHRDLTDARLGRRSGGQRHRISHDHFFQR